MLIHIHSSYTIPYTILSYTLYNIRTYYTPIMYTYTLYCLIYVHSFTLSYTHIYTYIDFITKKALFERYKQQINTLQTRIQNSKNKVNNNIYKNIHIIHRFHFSSQLQRMSVLCKCIKNNVKTGSATNISGSGATAADADYYSLVKGMYILLFILLLCKYIQYI